MSLRGAWIDKPVRVVFVFVAVLLVSGLLALSIPLGYLPGRGNPSISVTVDWRGAFEAEVERDLTAPLEDALAEIPDIEELFSLSERGRSRVYLRFRETTDLDEAYLEVREAVDGIESLLPESAQRPVLAKSGFDEGPVFIAAFGPGSGRTEEELERLFEGVEGSGEVEASGGAKREIRVHADERRLASSGLSLLSLAEAESKANVVGAFGRIGEPPAVFDHRLKTPRDFGAVPLGRVLRTEDVAEIAWAEAERESLSLTDGRETVILYVRAAGDANAPLLSEKLRLLTAGIPDSRVLHDRGALVAKVLRETAAALVAGSLLVVLFTFLFTRSAPAAAVVSLSIPFSGLISLAVLALAGFELDVMTLAGLAAGSGLLVTSCILYGETFFRLGRDPERTLEAAGEPVVYSSATTACVFLPLLFSPARLTSAYGGLGLAVSASLGASVLYVRFFMPAFLVRIAGGADSRPVPRKNPQAPEASPGRRPAPPSSSRLAGRALRFLRAHRKATAAALAAFGSASALLASGLSFGEPDFGTGSSLRLVLEYPSGTTLARVTAGATVFGERLRSIRGVAAVSSKFEKERATFDLDLRDASVRDFAEAEARKAVSSAGGAFLHVPEPGGGASSFEVILAGPTTGQLTKTAEDLAGKLRGLPGVRGIVYRFKEALPSKVLVMDPAAAARLGVSPARAASDLRRAVTSPVADKVLLDEEELDLRLGAKGGKGFGVEDLLAFPVRGATGPVRLGSFTEVSEREETGRICRTGRRRSASFSVLTESVAEAEVIAKSRKLLESFALPRDFIAEIAPAEAEKDRDFRETLLLLALALASVLLVLVFEFEALGVPLFILAQAPFVLAFPVLLFWLLGLPFTAPAAVGLVLALGIGVNDSLLLFGRKTRAPFDPDRLARAFADNFPTILSTSLTAAAGVLPLLLPGEAGKGALAPLSLVVAAGTLSAPLVLAAFIAIIPDR